MSQVNHTNPFFHPFPTASEAGSDAVHSLDNLSVDYDLFAGNPYLESDSISTTPLFPDGTS
ncbi:MAG: hypothetical protein KME65_19185, partial [Candidatus Thiodiazotropha sp. (ex Ctena orbiculata)]|nr:hypothetical protein [Candidatus Thiodiazotropha taylori]